MTIPNEHAGPGRTTRPDERGVAAGGRLRAVVAVVAPAVLLGAATTQTWARGTGGDVLGHGPVEVSGASASPGIVGLGVIAVVSLLALLTGGRVIRSVAAVVMVVAAAGAAALALLVALRPRQVVADALAVELARTTTPDATGAATAWAWAGLGAALLLVLGALVAALASRSWPSLSARYERGGRPRSGPRGEVRTAWDEISEGQDPTLGDDSRGT